MNTTRKRILLLALPILLLSCGKELTSQEHIVRAKDYIDVGEYSAASIELLGAATKDPKNLEARFELAKVSYALGDFERAEKEVRKAIELGLSRASGQPLLMLTLAATSKRSAAIIEGSALAEGMDGQAKSLVLGVLAQAFLGEKNYDKARSVLALAKKHEPVSEEVILAHAALEVVENDLVKAKSWLRTGLDQNQDSAKLWGAMGDMESMLGARDSAKIAYTRAISLLKYPSLYLAKRAMISIEQGNSDEAAPDIGLLRNSSYKDYWYVNYLEGRFLFSQDRYDTAAQQFELALRQAKSHVESLVYLAVAHMRMGHSKQALKYADQLAFLMPNSSEVKLLQGDILFRDRSLKEAANLLGELEQIESENQELLRLQGMVHFADGDGEKAKYFFEKLLKLRPNSVEALNYIMLSGLLVGQDLTAPGFEVLQENLDEYTRSFLRAASHFQQGRLLLAREQSKQLIESYPNAPEPRNLLAATYLAVRDWEQARIELHQVLEIVESDETALKNLARLELVNDAPDLVRGYVSRLLESHRGKTAITLFVYDMWMRLGDIDKAEQLLKEEVANKPGDEELLSAFMLRLYQTGRYDEIIEFSRLEFFESLYDHPRIPDILALAFYKSGNIALALNTAQKFIRAMPESALAQFRYASLLAKTNDKEAAAAAYAEAARLSPLDTSIAIERIQFLGQTGDLSAASIALEEALGAHPNQAVLIGLQGWLALLKQDYLEAVDRLTDAQKRQPSSRNTVLLARALVYLNRTDEALEVMGSWLSDHSSDLDVLLNKAGLLLAREDEDSALEVYKTILLSYPDHIAALNNAAWLSRDTDLEAALGYALDARKRAPSDPYVLDTLGNIKLMQGETDAAITVFRQALGLAPDDQRIKLHLAEALISKKEIPEAKRILTTIVAGDPVEDIGNEARALLDTL